MMQIIEYKKYRKRKGKTGWKKYDRVNYGNMLFFQGGRHFKRKFIEFFEIFEVGKDGIEVFGKGEDPCWNFYEPIFGAFAEPLQFLNLRIWLENAKENQNTISSE